MIIEVLCRFSRVLSVDESKHIDEEIKLQEVLQGNDFDSELEKEKMYAELGQFEYSAMVLDLKDVSCFNQSDKEHTTLRFYNNATYTIKLTYENFKSVYQTLTGKVINVFIAQPKEDIIINIENGK